MAQSRQKEYPGLDAAPQGFRGDLFARHQAAPSYDQLAERRFELIPVWGFFVFLLYAMRRVDCRRCEAVVVEEVPWGNGKRQLINAYMPFLARWARRLLWKEAAEAFRTSWDKVFDAVEHVVTFGLRAPHARTNRRHRCR